jgi:hypothetical protein
MNLWQFEAGSKLMLNDGTEGEVVSPTKDGVSLRIRYTRSTFHPEIVGTEGEAKVDEVVARLEPRSMWSTRNGKVHDFSPRSWRA